MTTTIKLVTHDWPVKVTINDDFKSKSDTRCVHGYNTTEEFVPAHTETEYYITDTRHISFKELKKDATKLEYDEYGYPKD